MLKIRFTTQMKRDAKLQRRRGRDMSLLKSVLADLAARQPLPERCDDHRLHGDWHDFRECHIQNDWVLVYRVFEDELILSATRTGTHADFGW